MNLGIIRLTRNEFQSRIVRNSVGERAINISLSLQSSESSNSGGGLSGVLGLGSRLIGFLISIVLVVGRWFLQNIWECILITVYEVINFDWNQSDQSIRARIESNNQEIISNAGGLIGTGLVWVAIIAIAGGLRVRFPVISSEVVRAIAYKGGEEIREAIIQFLYSCTIPLIQNIILSTVLTLRKYRLFGNEPITQRREPWTIAKELKELIRSIPIDSIRAILEGLLRSVSDPILEPGFVIGYDPEEFYFLAKEVCGKSLGRDRAIRIHPDDRVDGESTVLLGAQKLLIPTAHSVLGQYSWIWNRDVGQIVGQPVEDWLRAGVQRRKLTIVFKSVKTPPWRVSEKEGKVRQVTYTIPEPRAGLTWAQIKQAANQWTWGKFRATANLTGGRQMAVHGATAQDAEEKLKDLLSLSTLQLLTLSVTEEKQRHANLQKENRTMFPAYATLLVRRSTDDPTARTDLTGENFRDERVRFELWTEKPPFNLPPLE